jgi:L-fuconolactonase
MLRIDAHQHFWQFDPVRDSWITEDMVVIRKNFMPEDLQPLLQAHQLDGCIVVQADQSETETNFQLANAAAHDFIKGVVGWIDLQAPNITERLAYYKQFGKLKGFRHILQGEADRAHMLQPAFKHGISQLQQFGFTYDILIFPDQLQYVPELLKAFPNQFFVIDHLAKPYIRDKKIDEWKKAMQTVAQYHNVYCKISGMVTEANWITWKPEDFTPYLDTVVEAFGANRIMFGSDWPVCLLAASYDAMIQVVKDYFAGFPAEQQALFFGGNAAAFYTIE